MNYRQFLFAAFLVVPSIAIAASQVNSPDTAIRRARQVCGLDNPKGSGRWQAALHRDSWHVWFGQAKEPVCGFFGAYVAVDGAFTSCVIGACKVMPRN